MGVLSNYLSLAPTAHYLAKTSWGKLDFSTVLFYQELCLIFFPCILLHYNYVLLGWNKLLRWSR